MVYFCNAVLGLFQLRPIPQVLITADSVAFEINYIILTQSRYILLPTIASEEVQGVAPVYFTWMPPPSDTLRITQVTSSNSEATRGSAELDMLWTILNLTAGKGEASGKSPASTLKKTMPFSSILDDGSIVHLDNEWLYEYPDFLLTPDLQWKTMQAQLIRSLSQRPSERSGLPALGDSDTYAPDIIKEQLRQYLENPHTEVKLSSTPDAKTYAAQIPKQKYRNHQAEGPNEDWFPEYFCLSNQKLWDHVLSGKRTAWTAKKRFIWLPRANSETALLCWMASIENERIPMALFFDRHWRYESHLWDDTTRQSNTWQTELHLSFYTLVDAEVEGGKGFPAPITFAFSGASSKMIAHAAMGFRFDGDFFDRYWTCHFIQHIPGIEADSEIEWDFEFHRNGAGAGLNNEKQWWQRKVLEIHLLNRILTEIMSGATIIMRQVGEELRLEEKNLSNLSLAFLNMMNKKIPHPSNDRWPDIQIILRAVDDELTSALGVLKKWQSRETDRGKEQPRWTRNDERKYRGYINKFQAQTERHIWGLEMSRDGAHKLLETITTKQEQLRTEAEARHEGNIRNFTYVTVIFLPLGFATSLYSMSGPPQYLWLISLVEISAAAFAVTIFLITCVRLLLHYKAELGAALKSGWMSSIFLEIPARRVSIAISQLKHGTSPSVGAAVLRIILGILCSVVYVVARAFQVLLSMAYGYTRSIIWISGKSFLLSPRPSAK